MNQFDLKNRTAIITGGAQGFGLDIAKRFLASGAKVIIWDIDKNELLEEAILSETNRQFTQFSVIYYNKINLNSLISEQ